MEGLTRTSFLKRAVRSQAFTLVILLMVLILIFSILSLINDANFFSAKTFITILQDLAVPAFLAIGAACLIVSGAIDLSQAAVGALSGVIVAIAISWWGMPWYVAVVIALAVSAGIGLVNAVLVNELRLVPFIATMAMMAIVKALIMLLSTDEKGVMQSSINFRDQTLTSVSNFSVLKIVPATVVLVIVAFIIYGLILKKTKMGRSIYMIGGNPMAARLTGINAKKISYFLFVNCSMLGGLSGIIYTARSKQGSLQALSGDQFTGLTAAILGGISFSGGSGGMGGAFIGLLLLKTFYKGMMIGGSSTYLTSVLSGALLIVALTLDVWSQKRQNKRLGV
jgi:ribose/xylose/arabinose/galactoside ABC-type transport system permease subunit